MIRPANCASFVAVALTASLSLPLFAGEPPPPAVKSLSVFPTPITLTGPRDRQRLGVLGESADGRRSDLTAQAGFRGSTAAVAAVEGGIVRPVGDGEATVTVEVGGQSASLQVKVTGAKAEVPVSFSREVVPVLTKAGCNQGACHGSQHGRGGFKLSLLGFDPSFDH